MQKQPTNALVQRGVGTLPVLAACCGLAAVVCLGLWTAERHQVATLDQERVQTAAALDHANSQIQNLTSRLNAMAEQPAPTPVVPRAVAAPSPRSRAASQNRPRPARAPAADARLDRLQGQLADTERELASTRDQLAQNTDELDGRINSTRDDLNGSIARTHDEVVALQKRGEQNIYEFKLTKSKALQHVGPLSLSLRSTNVKHKTYDLAMTVDDNALTKNHVNLYEPVWITLNDRPQSVQLVVNHVEKNEIEGYLSEPKYKNSDLATTSTQSAQPTELTTRDQRTDP